MAWREWVGLVCFTVLLSVIALGQDENKIFEWGGAQGGYSVFQETQRVVITAPGTYKFAACTVDPNDFNTCLGLGDIRSITIAEGGVNGTVDIYVRDPNAATVSGAANLYKIDLRGASEGNIRQLRIGQSLGGDFDVHATRIGGAGAPGIRVAGSILHDVYVDYLDAQISCAALENITVSAGTAAAGQIQVNGSYSATMDVTGEPDIVVTGVMSGVIDITGEPYNLALGSVSQGASITIHGNLAGASFGGMGGALHVTGNLTALVVVQQASLSGSVTVDGDVVANAGIWLWEQGISITGQVNFNSNCAGNVVIGPYFDDEDAPEPAPWENDLSGTLAITGDLSGHVSIGRYVTGSIVVGGSLTGAIKSRDAMWDVAGDLSGGHIIVYGSYAEPGRIVIGGGFAGDTEFIAFDYNGGDLQDSWESQYWVGVGGQWYSMSDPDARVWEISDCKGDLNGDAVVDLADINAFVLALANAEEYSLAYPGLGGTAADNYLGGSRPFHGDVNCNGTFGLDDINPFVALMQNPCCHNVCDPCPAGRGDNAMQAGAEDDAGGLSPEQMAAMLGGNVDPGLYNSLVTLVGENAGQQETEADAAYWEAVYYALIE
jgi:hypothetical protein